MEKLHCQIADLQRSMSSQEGKFLEGGVRGGSASVSFSVPVRSALPGIARPLNFFEPQNPEMRAAEHGELPQTLQNPET